jgi:hypothetical protein
VKALVEAISPHYCQIRRTIRSALSPQPVRSGFGACVQRVGDTVEITRVQVPIEVQGHRRRLVFYIRVIGVPPAIGRDGRGFSWREVVVFVPCLIRHQRGAELAAITLGHPLLDEYLAFVAARARINTWLAVASDLKIFFGVVAKEPTEVTAADVFAFQAEQRKPRLGDRVVRLEDGEAGLAARTIPVDCRACGVCMGIWRPAVTPASHATRFRPVWRRGAAALGAATVGCR